MIVPFRVENQNSSYPTHETYWALQCDFCNWSTQYLGYRLDEDECHRWLAGEAEVDIEASEDADMWMYFDHLKDHFTITSNNLYCKWCTDREILVRRWITLLDPRWLTTTVKDLATCIRNELPAPYVLAPTGLNLCGYLHDALMDAGCDNETVLDAFAQHDESLVRLLIDAINGRMSFGNLLPGPVPTEEPQRLNADQARPLTFDLKTWANLSAEGES